MTESSDPRPYVFDLDGGRPCLDFANTASASGDHLSTYADLVAFGAQANLLTPERTAWLHAEAERRPAEAEATLRRATALREALRGIFQAVANRARPSDADLDVLNANLATSLAHARVLPDAAGDAFAWGWSGTDLAEPLWPIVRSAAEILTSEPERSLVRECGAGDCAWLFMDATRNRSRQWCSMTSCGNREKARRHYQRVKAQRAADSAATPAPTALRSRSKPGVVARA
ncbi:MAG TPA: ABATE domain-containing protein [Chloroflexota bacterium]|nr:ABATE domain-containing protein [Chloroflexota bacterium]